MGAAISSLFHDNYDNNDDVNDAVYHLHYGDDGKTLSPDKIEVQSLCLHAHRAFLHLRKGLSTPFTKRL